MLQPFGETSATSDDDFGRSIKKIGNYKMEINDILGSTTLELEDDRFMYGGCEMRVKLLSHCTSVYFMDTEDGGDF
ncbi:hypothetical protein Tco_0510991 [Tanacetum coccineum]